MKKEDIIFGKEYVLNSTKGFLLGFSVGDVVKVLEIDVEGVYPLKVESDRASGYCDAKNLDEINNNEVKINITLNFDTITIGEKKFKLEELK